ncbi:MAG TPA: M20/M25/M40 family metallo-hydrolase [Vicinamibacterales bacterium]|nr:M20/M25/M40 family metallo-hydrolase [Vicinamibacterales bacterium]
MGATNLAMDMNRLPIDLDRMLDTLRRWVESESPTWDAAAVSGATGAIARDFAVAGGRIEPLAGRMGFAGCVRISFPHATTGPGVLLLGHADTVHPIGAIAMSPWRRDDERWGGPGVVDMKGGLCTSLEAIRQLAAAGISTPLPLTVLLTSDEEAGSPSTREVIEAEAARHKYVLVPEPGRTDGGVVTGRYAIARFTLQAIGRPSHAGARLADGRSAIREMARKILAIEAMTTEDCTFSVGVIAGGRWVNCVPARCTGEALSMAKRQCDLDSAVSRMLALASETPDITFTAMRGATRPVWETSARDWALYEQARTIAASLGVELPHQSAGGGSDANFTGSMGIATLDGLGPVGDGYHTLDEHLRVGTLAIRTRLMAGLLATLA